ncbi:MAG: ComEC/Rec2 family competence protein [Candidatus Omnitrophica bacterium]|nr:ComEC/Rec2 family competence protein [Candidatus Omnitrophota bacterium]
MRRPLAGPVAVFVSGILAAGIISKAHAWEFIVAIGILLFCAIFFSAVFLKKNKIFFILVYVFFFLLGIFSVLRIFPEKDDIGEFVSVLPARAVIFGTVSGICEDKNVAYDRYSVFSLKVKKLLKCTGEHDVSGFVRVRMFDPVRKVYPGESLAIGGEIFAPEEVKNRGVFDYKKHLGRRRIGALMSNSPRDVFLKTYAKKTGMFLFHKRLMDVRLSAVEIFEKRLINPASAIVKSAILGARGDLTKKVRDVFLKTGTMHILAVSGLHVGIIAVILAMILRITRCPKKITFFLTICAICVFAVFTGARPSTLRAVIMASFILINLAIGKNSDIVNGLILSAFVILFFRPEEIYNLGFVLSYLSIFSIVYVMPLVKAFFENEPRVPDEGKIGFIKRYFLISLATSFSVWIGLMPIISLNFGMITPTVVISNLIAVPILFVVIILGACIIAAEVFVVFIPVGILISQITNGVIRFFIKIMTMISEMPLAFVKVGPPSGVLIGAFYAGLIFTIIFFNRKKRKIIFIIFLLFTVNLFIWQEILNATGAGAFKCTFFSVGKADAALFEFPNSGVMMIDGGRGGSITGLDAGANIVAPYLRGKGKRKIDCVLVSHAHEDHVGGLSFLVENFETGCVIMSEFLLKDDIKHGYYKRFLRIVEEKGIRKMSIQSGDVIKGFSDAGIEVLNPSEDHIDLNDRSIVLNVKTKNGNSILFCADISTKITNEILANYPELKADIIKFPHHGSGFGNIADMEKFLDSIGPKAVIITNKTCGVNKELMEILKQKQIELYITGDSGAVTVVENGADFKIRTFCELE